MNSDKTSFQIPVGPSRAAEVFNAPAGQVLATQPVMSEDERVFRELSRISEEIEACRKRNC